MKMTPKVLVAALAVAVAACDDSNPAPTAPTTTTPTVTTPTVPANRAPQVATGINDATLQRGNKGTVNLEESPVNFTDPDGDDLTYTASSSNTHVASADVVGTVLEIVAANIGRADIRVTARDPGGLTATLTFSVTVTGGSGTSTGTSTGGGVVTTHAGACTVDLRLGPGGSCDVGSDRFEVLSDGRGRYGCCITAGTGININGFRANRISGTDNWRIEALP